MREVLRLCKIPFEHPWSFFSGSSNIFVPPLFFWFRAPPFRHPSSSDNKGISCDTSYSCCCFVCVWSLQGARVSLPQRRRFSCWMARLQKGSRPWLGTLSSKLQKKTHPKTLSSKNTVIQKHFHPKTLSSKTISSKREDNFIHDTFIQKRVHPMTLSSKNGFVQ